MGFFSDVGDAFSDIGNKTGGFFQGAYDKISPVVSKIGNKAGDILDKSLQRIDRMNEAATNAFEGLGNLLNSPVLLVIGGCVVLYIITQA